MLIHVVAIPLDDRPVELLPPCSGYRESVRRGIAERRNRGRVKKETLKIPVRGQLLNLHFGPSAPKAGSSLSDPVPAACSPPSEPREYPARAANSRPAAASRIRLLHSKSFARPESSACSTECCPDAVAPKSIRRSAPPAPPRKCLAPRARPPS